MIEQPLTKRQMLALSEIRRYRGSYHIAWTPKTRESLEARGLVKVAYAYVSITAAGLEHLE